MIKTMIIEDERLIADELKKMILTASSETELVGTFSSVTETVQYLSANEEPDLIFSDVQLPDGLSFDIFNRVQVKSPVIFVTAYDKYIVNAFENNAIDYLLKPIDEADLKKAIKKYREFREHFSYPSFLKNFRQRIRSRLIVRKGIENIALKLDDVVIAYTEDKVVFVIDHEGKKYRVDKSLAELEKELDPSVFFRANRQYIINISFIKSYKAFDKVKLQIDLRIPEIHHQIIISQENAADFRKWISEK